MMSFGWRPNQSCYSNVAKVKASEAVKCPSAMWFYLLLGVAVIAGTSGRK